MLALVFNRVAGNLSLINGQSSGSVQVYSVIDNLFYAETNYQGPAGAVRGFNMEVVVLNPGLHTLTQRFLTSDMNTNVAWQDNHTYLLLFRFGKEL